MEDNIKVYRFIVDAGSSVVIEVESTDENTARDSIDELLYGQDYLKEMLSLKNAEVVITLEEVSKS